MDIKKVHIQDAFWKPIMELVRTEVIPYQWELLNDKVADAAPSFCMRNFKIASKLIKERNADNGLKPQAEFTYRGFEVLPEDMEHLEDQFYGFVFQDSDFYKWIEAVAYSLAVHPDKKLEELADEAIDTVCAAQLENGYLDTYYIIGGMSHAFTNLKDHHELYCMGHLIEGAIAYYEATGKDKLLHTAMKFADYVDSVFGKEPGKIHGYPGHEIAEMALIRLYEITGERRYLDLACYFIDERGTKPYYWMSEAGYKKGDEKKYTYNQSHLPVREQEEAVGHAVRAMYLYCAMADDARITGDESLWNACHRLWNSVTQEKMYITGGIGATSIGEAFSFPFDLPNDLAYAETCASIGLFFWAWRMLKNEKKADYGDIMELTLYNSILSGMSQDGKHFFYVNPLEVLPEACEKDERKSHVKAERQKWFGCACCPPNLARTLMSIGKYAFMEMDDTFFIHLYVGVETYVQNKKIKIASGFPWDGNVQVEIGEDMEKECRIAMRIPGWSSGQHILENAGAGVEEKEGYLYFNKKWKKGDKICIEYPMKTVVMKANSMVREDCGKVAIRRGPMVYCMEEADNGRNLHLLNITLPPKTEDEKMKYGKQTFVRIKAEGTRSQIENKALYTEFTQDKSDPVTLVYVPYFFWNNRGKGEMQVWTRY